MPSKSEIARAWGVAPSWITQCCKKGMPTDTLEAANEWRAANAQQRAPVDNKRGKKRGGTRKGRGPGRPPKEETPSPKRGRPKESRIPPPVKRDSTGDSLLDTLNSAIFAQELAEKRLADVMDGVIDAPIAPTLQVHSKAVEQRMKVERMYREELEIRKVLVRVDEALALSKRGLVFMVQRLSELPEVCAQKCNPKSPRVAREALKDQCDMIVNRAREIYLKGGVDDVLR